MPARITLAQLLAAVAVVAAVATVALPAMVRAMVMDRERACSNNLSQLRKMADAYRLRVG
jgi:type II secretory pathway pseudopilin PulG